MKQCCYERRNGESGPKDAVINVNEDLACVSFGPPSGFVHDEQADDKRMWLRADQELVVGWLLNGSKVEVLAVLARIAASRPQLLRDAADALDAMPGLQAEGRSDLAVNEVSNTVSAPTELPGQTRSADLSNENDRRTLVAVGKADATVAMDSTPPGAETGVNIDDMQMGWEDSSSRKRRRQKKKRMMSDGPPVFQPQVSDSTRAAAAAANPVVQFATFTYFMNEEDGHVALQVIRIGDLSRPSAVNFETKDGTAKKGVTYKHASGTLYFGVNESEKTINVEILPNKHWETTLQFGVELSWTDIQNARLGEHTWRSRIKVLDSVCFPSDKYREQILRDKDRKDDKHGLMDEVPHWDLLYEYLKFNWGYPVVWKRSKKILLLDVFNNFIFLSELLLKTFLTDYILHPQAGEFGILPIPADGSPKAIALLLVVLWRFFPMIFQHRLDHLKTLTFGVGGPSRLILQSGLFRKFLEVDYATRSKLHAGDVRTAITRDASNLASEGYSNFLKIFKELGNLVMMLLYAPFNCWLFGRYFSMVNTVPVVCIIIFPLVLVIFLMVRKGVTTDELRKRHAAFGKMNEVVEIVVSNFNLIAAYNQRPQSGEDFASAVRIFNKNSNDCDAVLRNNLWFAKWLSQICTGTWIFVGGRVVIRNKEVLSLGAFLVNLEIFARMGECWITIYDILLEMETTLPAVVRVTRFMNLPTDMANWKEVSDYFRQQTLDYRRKHILEERPAGEALVDSLPICLANMRFQYTSMPDKPAKDFKGRLQIAQGQVACLAGPKGGGKSTILKLLGGEVFPSSKHLSESQAQPGSSFLVPSHLRCLHVAEPMFMPGTLWDNLVYGSLPNSEEAKELRVLSICRRLRIADDVMALLHDKHAFGHVLSQTQRQLVSIARALTVNPEILIIHKPTLVFANAGKRRVEAAIREFVDNRGFECDPAAKHLRRPRTCIMTASSLGDVECSNTLFRIGLRGTMQEVSKVGSDTGQEDFHAPSESSSGSASEHDEPQEFHTTL